MKSSTLWTIVGVIALAGVVWWLIQPMSPQPDPNAELDFGSEVTLTGEVECAPKASDGPQTLECAFALASDGGHYQLTQISGANTDVLQIGSRVEVTGMLVEPPADTTYDIVGVIEVSNIARAGDGTATTSDDIASNTSGWQTYTVSNFSLRFPPEQFSLIASEAEAPPEVESNVPPCGGNGASVVCTHYTGDEFRNTNFDSAGVDVNTIEAQNQSACVAVQGNARADNIRRETVGDIEWLIFETGQAATNSVAEDTIYRSWQHGQCYEIVSRIAYQNYEVFEPGTVEEFTDEMKSELRATLTRIVESVRF